VCAILRSVGGVAESVSLGIELKADDGSDLRFVLGC
jgi:hypothetical protein